MNTPPVLPYHSNRGVNERFRIFVFYYCLNLVISGALAAYMVYVVPEFRAIFNDFRVELPGITTWMLNASDVIVNRKGWLLLVPLVLGWSLLPAYLFTRFENRPWHLRFLFGGFVLFYFSIVFTILVAVIQPFLSLINSIRGGPP